MAVAREKKVENELKCLIKNIVQFKTCLESVKFPTTVKSKFNDVILQAHQNGIVLKSAAHSGNIMTRCMIRKDFFFDNSYCIDLKNPDDIKALENPQPGQDNKTLIEFCLPFAELKHIVEGMCEDENAI